MPNKLAPVAHKKRASSYPTSYFSQVEVVVILGESQIGGDGLNVIAGIFYIHHVLLSPLSKVVITLHILRRALRKRHSHNRF